jgi:hypothetical protein
MGEIIETSLLNSPFLSWDGMVDCTFTLEEINTLIGLMFHKIYKQILGSKNIKQFLTTTKNNSMCIFTPNVVQHIIDK